MTRNPLFHSLLAVACVPLLLSSTVARAAEVDSALNGMWSDPPPMPEDFFCYFYCTEAGIAYLGKLLDDPANDSRPFAELNEQAGAYQLREVVPPHLTDVGRKDFPRDPADDPSFLRCEPYTLTRQIFAPHQLEIRTYDDRVEMHYGEWDARRIVHLDNRKPSPGSTPMGFSVGRFDGDSLIVTTTNVSAGLAVWRGDHSDRLEIVEVYRRSGDRLLLTATIVDPVTLERPLELRKVWGWAPDEEIFPYENCEVPTEFSREGADR